jgi:amidase
MYGDSFTVLMFELREEMGKYLESLPRVAGRDTLPRSLADLIAFNAANADTEMRWFGQELFELAETTTGTSAPV